MNNKCIGCGAHLQEVNKDEVGYRVSNKHIYCMSCFKLNHYGKDINTIKKEAPIKIKKDSLVIVITSILNIHQIDTFNLNNLGKNLKFIYLINQTDLLDKKDVDKINTNLSNKHKYNNDLYDIIFMSALNKKDTLNFKNYLLNTPFLNVYFYGVQNSGKTTIMNALLNNKASTSLKAGLTFNEMKYEFKDKTLYDLPGIKKDGSIEDLLPYEIYKNIIPAKKIIPRNYYLNENQYLIINDLFKIKPNKKGTIVLYIHNDLKITKRNIKSFAKTNDEIITNYKTNDNMQINLSNIGFIHTKELTHISLIYNKLLVTEISRRLF